jgi:hypothetical protein
LLLSFHVSSLDVALILHIKSCSMLRLATFAIFFCASIAAAQEDSQPKTQNPLFTSDLIAWSNLPAPLPIPQITGPERSFSGIVTRQSDVYLLQLPDSNSYRLDRPELISLYEGHQISVVGALDESGKQIQIHQIADVK